MTKPTQKKQFVLNVDLTLGEMQVDWDVDF